MNKITQPSLVAPVVSTQWLADQLGAEHLAVVDATVFAVPGPDGRPAFVTGHESYLVHGHMPGAVFADILGEFSDPGGDYPFTRPARKAFEKAVSALGIDNETTVVVYDGAVGQWASRIWWLFRSFGYDQVAVLDGGLVKWTAEGRSLETGAVEPRRGHGFHAEPRAESWVDKADIEAVVEGSASGALVCGLPPKEFSGETGPRPRPGHIPGSHSIPAGRLVDRETNAFLPEARLRELFEPVLAESSRVILYCAGGIAATADALALTLIGESDIAVYDGSLNEWSADPAAPLVTAA